MTYTKSKTKEELYNEYIIQGLSIGKIAKQDGVTSTIVRKLLKKYNIPTRQQQKITQEEIEQCYKLRSDGMSIKEIADVVSRPPNTVQQIFSKTKQTLSRPTQITKKQLINLYITKNLSAPQIAKQLSVNSSSVYNWLKYYNINKNYTPIYKNYDLYDMYIIQDLSIYEIAEKIGEDVQAVRYGLNKLNVPIKQKGWRTVKSCIERCGKENYDALNNKDTLSELCKQYTHVEIGERLGFSQTAISNKVKEFGIKFSPPDSTPERLIKEFLEQYNIELHSNTRSIISPYELDLVLPDYKLAIEVNGCFWHSIRQERIDKNYHKRKTEMCLKKGYKLFQLWDYEITDPIKFYIIKQKLLYAINKLERIYARNTSIVDLNIETEREFLTKHHIQGYKISSYRYGLQDNDGNIVAIISFKKLKDGTVDLIRYATSKGVVGGFSKLLNHFLKNTNYKKIITFANMRFSSTNNVYEKMGFKRIKWNSPNYFYEKSGVILSRQQCMKHKLHKILDNFDPNVTELQNMINHRWNPIYDCGHIKYEFTTD